MAIKTAFMSPIILAWSFSILAYDASSIDDRQKEREQQLQNELDAIDLSDENTRLFWDEVLSGIRQISTAVLRLKYQDPNSGKDSKVVVSSSLDPQEINFLRMRKRISDRAFINNGISTAKKPVIGLCMSGGGYRAMLSSLGFASAIAQMGIFDMATYNVGLSGSSWHLSKLMLMALKRAREANPVDFKALTSDIIERAQRIVLPDIRSLSNIAHLLSPLVGKYVYGQIITPTDLYGILLGASLLGLGTKEYEKTRFSSFASVTDSGAIPMPIGTAVSKTNAHWFEFTPYRSGSPDLGTFIESYGLGRKFSGGKSVDTAPEASLHNMMAIMGSAFSIKGFDIVRHLGPKLDFLPESMAQKLKSVFDLSNLTGLMAVDEDDVAKHEGITFKKIIEKGLVAGSKVIGFWQKIFGKQPDGFVFIAKPELAAGGLGWEEQGIIPGGIFANPFLNVSSNKATSRLFSEPNLELKDAGIDFNLPFPPLLRPERGVNIILAYDASGDLLKLGAVTLKFAAEYAKRQGLRFPALSADTLAKAGQQNMTVIGNPADPRELTIIYIPLLRNPNLPGAFGQYSPLHEKVTSTANFVYPKADSAKLIEAVKQNVLYFERDIKNVILQKAQSL